MASTPQGQGQTNAESLSLKYQTNKRNLKILTYGGPRMATKKEENPFEEMAPLTYTDQIYSMLGLWKTKGVDCNMMMIKEIEISKNKLNTLKQGLDVDKNTLLLETNWEELNAQRKEQGLTKISNESMRKAYIDQQILMEKIEYNKRLNEHETLLRIYETMEA